MAKIALLIGVSEYGEGIPPLSAALNDVEAMERVLQNPNLGGFEQVERLLNPDAIAMRRAIQKLFKEAAKDDLVLLFFSGHGITNDEEHLYLATRNTAKDDFEATAVDASFIQGQSNNCYAKRQVLILDACYSGAYAQGWRTKSVGVDIKKQLGAEGRVILTSSSATQTSFEQEGATLSLYTQYLVEGIETGAADTDNDGNIHVQELHAYAKAKVQAVKPKMTPEIILDREGFNILLAYAPKNPEAEYRKLVEQYAQHGELNEFAFLVLKPKRKTFGLTDAKAEEIETEVLEPFHRRFANLENYKQAFAKAVEQKYPLDEHILKILKDYQQDVLGLRHEDIASIELEITSAKETEYQKQVQIQKQREKEEYGNNLRRYEQELSIAVKAGYPLDEYVRNGLKQFQQSLGLRDEDIALIEQRVFAPKQAEYDRQKQESEKLRQEQEKNSTIPLLLDKVRGDDLRLDLKLDFREAIFGGEKEIRISHIETCEVCKGSGAKSGNYPSTCITCDGSGQLKRAFRTHPFGINQVSNCQTCEGTGKVIGEKCDFCDGKGTNQVTKTLLIMIPSGVDNGVRLRISQEGDAGQRGGSPGDLYAYLLVNEDQQFKRDGINILSEIMIDHQQALLGCRLEVNTVDGLVELTIPPKTQPNAVMKLKNRGVPRLGNPSSRGDHLITVIVKS